MEQKMMMEMEHTPCPGTGAGVSVRGSTDANLVPEQVLGDVRYARGQVERITTHALRVEQAGVAVPSLRDAAQRALDAMSRVEAVLVEAMAWDVRVTTVDPSVSLADVVVVEGGAV